MSDRPYITKLAEFYDDWTFTACGGWLDIEVSHEAYMTRDTQELSLHAAQVRELIAALQKGLDDGLIDEKTT